MQGTSSLASPPNSVLRSDCGYGSGPLTSLLPSTSASVPQLDSSCAQAVPPSEHEAQQSPKLQTPEEIPPEAVQEYMDIMEQLIEEPDKALGHTKALGHSVPGAFKRGRKTKHKEPRTCPDPGLLSYIDELCSQEDFVSKVGGKGADGEGRRQGASTGWLLPSSPLTHASELVGAGTCMFAYFCPCLPASV